MCCRGRDRLLDEPQPRRRHRRLIVRQIDHELGAVRREEVLADEHCLAGAVGGDTQAAQQRRANGDPEQLRLGLLGEIGTDRLGRAAQVEVEQLVERRALDVLT